MCCDDENNPYDFTIEENITFGPSADGLTESIVFYFKNNGVAIPLTGYDATFKMWPVTGSPDLPTLQFSSLTSPPLSSVVIGAAEGSVSPYFNQSDITMPNGSYSYEIMLSKSGVNSDSISGTITKKG